MTVWINKKTNNKKFIDNVKEVLAYIGIYSVLLIFAFVILYPVIWIVGSSFTEGSSLATATAIPRNPSLRNYIRLLEETKYKQWYLNTLTIAVINMGVSVVLTGTMGYVFARLKFAGIVRVLRYHCLYFVSSNSLI